MTATQKQAIPKNIRKAIGMLEDFKERYDHILMSDDLEEIDAIIFVLSRT